MNELLLRMLSTTLWRNTCLAPFYDLKQRLLNTLTRNVTRNREVFCFTRNLVDFIDINNANFSTRNIEICSSNKL